MTWLADCDVDIASVGRASDFLGSGPMANRYNIAGRMGWIMTRSVWAVALVFAIGVVACDSGGDGSKDSGIPPDVSSDVISDVTGPDVAEVNEPDSSDPRDILDAQVEGDGANDVDLTAGDEVTTIGDTSSDDHVADLSDLAGGEDVSEDDNDSASDVEEVMSDLGPCPDDELECTTSERDGDGVCVTRILMDYCLVDGVCLEKDTVNPDNDCLFCVPESANDAWSLVDGATCNDPTPCSVGGVCAINVEDQSVSCVSAEPICWDDNDCTYDRCINGACSNPPRQGATCDDHSACTYQDHCETGVCVGYVVDCIEDDNPCTDDYCDPEVGCVHTPNEESCNDGDFCSVGDSCRDGVCKGDVRDCSDDLPCTNDRCIAGPAGYCSNEFFYGDCDDGSACTVGDTCGVDHLCVGNAVVCNDFNDCTSDSCDRNLGCVFSPRTGACNDEDACTYDDACVDSECVGTPKTCDDGKPCTNDYCQGGVCKTLPMADGLICDDSNLCTLGDHCISGLCVPSSTQVCNDVNLCTLDTCDPELGCNFPSVVCNDDDVCTTDSCNPSQGCVYSINTETCNDNDACTVNDTCAGGVCGGQPKDCNDGDSCTIDECFDGKCQYIPNIGDCEDGDLCTSGEFCLNGVCQGGTAIVCNDFETCTSDSCNPDDGCVYLPIAGACNDHSVCTTGDRCGGGECVGDRIDCSDGNFCTDDLCDDVDGCYCENNALLCDDGNVCTVQDQCGGGVCAGANMFDNPVSKSKSLVISSSAEALYAVDIDGDGTLDNAFGGLDLLLKAQFNPQLATAVITGAMGLFLEHETPGPGTGPYPMNIFFGQRVEPTACDPTTSGCNYRVFSGDVSGTCMARYAFDNATVSGAMMTAGGREYEAAFYLMLLDHPLKITLKWARVEGTVTMSGGDVTGGGGILGGALDKQDFIYALQAVPDSKFTPYTKAQVINNVNIFLIEDMDVDNNGKAESASIGIVFDIVTGTVLGKL